MDDNIKHLIDNLIKVIMLSENKGITLIIKYDEKGYVIKYKLTRV